ncbi:MAG: HlyD family efflux transporter periplasmic adaptor subunit [Polyangiaceae bacterium]|nr:HlyD family efflux transporter periplasmic adaptor subunit [Polyangiaceae bacterium]
MRKNRASPILAFAVLALAAEVGACGGRDATPPGYQGVLELEERVLSFEASGRIEQIAVDEGDAVYAGMSLIDIDASLAQRQRDARAADVEIAKAELVLLEAGTRPEDVASLAAQVRAIAATEVLAKKNLERARYLEEQGASPLSDVDAAQAEATRAAYEKQSLEQRLLAAKRGARPEEIERARSKLASAEAAVRVEDERLLDFQLVAPMDARVTDVHVEEGELAINGGRAITIADPTHPYVDVFVPQGEIDGIVIGARSTVRVDGSTETFSGWVEHIATKTEFTPRYIFSERERPNLVVRVRVRVDDPRERLHAGVPAFAEIER